MSPSGLVTLAVDDEAPALDELAYLLAHSSLVARVEAASGAEDALRWLHQERFDVVVADIRMPGLDGLELAGVLENFADPPAVVFATAHDSHALEAFEVGAAGYLLKPLDPGRLEAVLARIGEGRRGEAPGSGRGDDYATVAVEVPGRTTIVQRSEVAWVEAAGDYVRLHTGDGPGHLVRIPISVLEQRWRPHGFARIHRGHLVALGAIRELRTEGTQTVARVGDRDLPVSRRHVGELHRLLVRHSTRPRR
jgi:two-component system response regulator LytT